MILVDPEFKGQKYLDYFIDKVKSNYSAKIKSKYDIVIPGDSGDIHTKLIPEAHQNYKCDKQLGVYLQFLKPDSLNFPYCMNFSKNLVEGGLAYFLGVGSMFEDSKPSFYGFSLPNKNRAEVFVAGSHLKKAPKW